MKDKPINAAIYSYIFYLGRAYRLLGRHEEAIGALLKRALSRSPNFWPTHGELANCYRALGYEEEAQAEVAEIRQISPNFSLEGARQRLPYKDPAVLERVLDDWRKAGLVGFYPVTTGCPS
jgi:tetratricopeptide (TPR) repeat protein